VRRRPLSRIRRRFVASPSDRTNAIAASCVSTPVVRQTPPATRSRLGLPRSLACSPPHHLRLSLVQIISLGGYRSPLYHSVNRKPLPRPQERVGDTP
jgi:hypothetical protein